MIHKELLKEIYKERLKGQFLYPDYGRYSIVEIVPTVLKLLGVRTTQNTFPDMFFKDIGEVSKVLFFLVDGLGFDHVESSLGRIALFDLLEKEGNIFPITSVFPSTTPAALTSVHTGLAPGQHGLPEWTVYMEEVDSIIETLPFKVIGRGERDSLLESGGKSEMLYEGATAYSQLKDKNVPSFVFIFHEYAASAYSRMTQKGATVIPFATATDLFQKLSETLEKEPRGYFFVYWNTIDTIEHTFGPGSSEHLTALEDFSSLTIKRFLKRLSPQAAERTLFLVSADHGQTPIEKEKIIYLNDLFELEQSYLKGKSSKYILPTGAPHDVFLFIYPPKLKEMLVYLRTKFEGKAEVLTTEEAVSRGLFGQGKPTEKFLKRIGNVLILPFKKYHVWYKHFPDSQFHQKGTHGGLLPEEMTVPFAVCSLEQLAAAAALL